MATTTSRLDTEQSIAALVGRALMSAIFIWSGSSKLLGAGEFQAYLHGLGVPFPGLAWAISVVIELAGGLALLVGIWPRAAASVLAVWCIITALVGHRNFADPEMRINFMKNVAMAGGFTVVWAFGGGVYTLDRLRVRMQAPHIARLDRR